MRSIRAICTASNLNIENRPNCFCMLEGTPRMHAVDGCYMQCTRRTIHSSTRSERGVQQKLTLLWLGWWKQTFSNVGSSERGLRFPRIFDVCTKKNVQRCPQMPIRRSLEPVFRLSWCAWSSASSIRESGSSNTEWLVCITSVAMRWKARRHTVSNSDPNNPTFSRRFYVWFARVGFFSSALVL